MLHCFSIDIENLIISIFCGRPPQNGIASGFKRQLAFVLTCPNYLLGLMTRLQQFTSHSILKAIIPRYTNNSHPIGSKQKLTKRVAYLKTATARSFHNERKKNGKIRKSFKQIIKKSMNKTSLPLPQSRLQSLQALKREICLLFQFL